MYIKSLKEVVGYDLFSDLVMGADLPVTNILTSGVLSFAHDFPKQYPPDEVKAKKEIQKKYLERLERSLAVANLTDLIGKRVILATRGYEHLRTDTGYTEINDQERVYLDGSIILNVGIFQRKFDGKDLGRQTPLVYCSGPRFEGTKQVFLERNFFNAEDNEFEHKWCQEIYGSSPRREGEAWPRHHVIFAVLP